jgi:uncharacterized protein YqgV (UPF0045/DUF77 family)
MEITVEISYYPLIEKYQQPVEKFINEIGKNKEVVIEAGMMSTLITGKYEEVLNLIQQKLKPLMEKYPSVFSLKISNACKT